MTQKQALDVMNLGHNVFITGKAGTGKSHLIQTFIKDNPSKMIHIVAPTGMAAVNVNGKTIHSLFKLPFGKFDFAIWQKKLNSWVIAHLQQIKRLIIDEISMVSNETLTAIDQILRYINQSTKPFGGVQMIVVGDFFQLECIISRDVDFHLIVNNPKPQKKVHYENQYYRLVQDGLEFFVQPIWGWERPKLFGCETVAFRETVRKFSWRPIKGFKGTSKEMSFSSDEVTLSVQTETEKERYKFAYLSPSWKEANFQTCYLSKVYRQNEGEELLNILDKIRRGELDDELYSALSKCKSNPQSNSTMLFAKNSKVDKINESRYNSLPTKEYIFKAKTKGDEREVEHHFKNSNFEKVLKLKKGERVMFIVNNPNDGYVNGTTGMITEIDRKEIVVTTDSDTQILVKPFEHERKDNRTEALISSILQIPLKPAWAITIHKSQGMTLESVSIDLSDAFTVGQGYVALSRCKTLSKIHLEGINQMALAVNPLSQFVDPKMQKASKETEQRLIEWQK